MRRAMWVLIRSGTCCVPWVQIKKFYMVAFVFLGTIFANMKTLQYANVETFIVFRSSAPPTSRSLQAIVPSRRLSVKACPIGLADVYHTVCGIKSLLRKPADSSCNSSRYRERVSEPNCLVNYSSRRNSWGFEERDASYRSLLLLGFGYRRHPSSDLLSGLFFPGP